MFALAARVKAHELRTKSKTELQSQVCADVRHKRYGVAAQIVHELFFKFSSRSANSEHVSGLQLKDLKQELGALRVAKVTGGAPNKLSKM